MSAIIKSINTYESPDFVDLDEIYGFSQTCSSGTSLNNCKSPCNAGMTKQGMMEMSEVINAIKTYEAPDFVDLDEVYGFSQTCSSGTFKNSCVVPCTQGK